MRPITESTIIDAVDRSVVETIEAFVRFRPGFHGDTGIRDYLYHRLMTNLPDNGKYTRAGGEGTLLAQAEWYTELLYCNTGDNSSPGRFDIGIPKPEELHVPKPRALVTFECGRNKRAAALLRDVDAIAEHEGPQPGDITKLAREICHKQLPYGYVLEFFDGGRSSEAEYLIRCLRRGKSKTVSITIWENALALLDFVRFQPVQFPLLHRQLMLQLCIFPDDVKWIHFVRVSGNFPIIQTVQNLQGH